MIGIEGTDIDGLSNTTIYYTICDCVDRASTWRDERRGQ